jgi:hypothetical protein
MNDDKLVSDFAKYLPFKKENDQHERPDNITHESITTYEKHKTKKQQPEPELPNEDWDMDYFRFPACILSVGKPKSGKTYNTRFLLTYFSHTKKIFKGGLVFTGSRDLNDDYDFLPVKAIINGYDEDVLKRYVENIEQYRKRTGQAPPASFIVFDDLLGKLTGSNYFNSFVSIYRHLNITIFINVQYMKTKASNTLLRETISYAFIWNTKTKNSIDSIYEVVGQLFDSKEDFKKHFFETTKAKHAAMLYIATRDELQNNYYETIAPENFKKIRIDFK